MPIMVAMWTTVGIVSVWTNMVLALPTLLLLLAGDLKAIVTVMIVERTNEVVDACSHQQYSSTAPSPTKEGLDAPTNKHPSNTESVPILFLLSEAERCA